MAIDLRRARSTEADQLTTIAIAAKRQWGYPDRWIDLWREQLTIAADYIAAHEVYAATIDQVIVGFYAVSDSGSISILDHLWVQPNSIGRGVGRRLLQHAIDQAKRSGAHSIEIESDPNAEGFYQHMGARRVSVKRHELEGQARELPVLRIDL
ncbi:MAG TPA: GNAT family N-acetyltransferase [Anaerolineae bacterium]|nr:GNAT family N-acetyltransferase [Anaerolineae bacterium]